MGKRGYVYILAGKRHGTLYVGVTSNLLKRVYQHRNGEVAGFTKRHGVTRLVHFEIVDDMTTAIEREKRLKRWRRIWKIELIEQNNSEWRDLWPEIAGIAP